MTILSKTLQITQLALKQLRPNSEYSLDGETIIWQEANENDTNTFVAKNLIWHTPTEVLQKQEYENAYICAENEYKALEYKLFRQLEYPPLTDLADALYWQTQGDDSKMTAYIAAVEAVKQKYPKGNA
jgi:hypothetical protein